MLTDAHCHPYDLSLVFPQAEEERQRLGVLAAASACCLQEFAHNEKSAADSKNAKLFPCFGVHPQQLAINNEQLTMSREHYFDELLVLLNNLAAEKRISAIGECGFDLFNEKFKETEDEQQKIFIEHLETAIRHELPVIIHARRAMHKIFAFSKELSKCKSVVFHSWPGTLEEGNALLRKKVNAYFSFGNVILSGHKKAIRSCAGFPQNRILTETDAPYQPAHGKKFSQWEDLPFIIKEIASLRGEDAEELEMQIEGNFREVFQD